MCKVSVIVPVHNSSTTLVRCVDSILDQTYKNLEVILIENGSEDNSLQMCKDYAEKDSRVKVLSLQTSGISKARNAGLNCKTGEYFTFIDSDDSIEPDMIEKLLTEAKESQADMTFCRVKNIKSDGEIFVSEEKRLSCVVNKEYKYLFLKGANFVRNVIWRILYKANVFEGFLFNEDMPFGEDLDFLLRALTVSKKNSLVDEPLYNYTYFYDNPKHIFNKYYNKTDSLFTTFKCIVNVSDSFCKRFITDDFADAVTYCKYVELLGILSQSPHYRSNLKLLYGDVFWREIDTKNRYKAFKKYYNKQSKIKAFLLKHKLFALYRFLFKVKSRFRRK